VDSLLNDPKVRALWVSEPNIAADFGYKNNRVVITGCFQHVGCKRLSAIGEPFPNFICSNCSKIEHKTDFRLRVMREGRALVKRGFRNRYLGRRVDYLSSQRLAAQSRQLARKYCKEKAMHWLMKSRVTQLKIKHDGLKLSAVESFIRKDVLSFCNNIFVAHRANAFGGKVWELIYPPLVNKRTQPFS